jgi:hypothetical protein
MGRCGTRCAKHDRITGWVKEGLTVVKIVDLLAREGVLVPRRTLHRYCQQRTEYRGRRATVPVADGEPGVEYQIDFARMGMLFDSEAGRRRVVSPAPCLSSPAAPTRDFTGRARPGRDELPSAPIAYAIAGVVRFCAA